MKLFDVKELYPGSPDCWTHPNGLGVQLRFPTTGRLPGQNRMTLDLTLAVDYALVRNLDICHFITQARADVAGWDSGYYKGHGAIVGPVLEPDGVPRAKIETWGPQYNANGPGGNLILPGTRSTAMRGETLYRVRVTSMLDAPGFKHIGMSVWEPNQMPIIDTGDIEDDNMAIDMQSDALLIAVHFQPKPEYTPKTAGVFRVSNCHVNHTTDCTPMPDMRRLWLK